MREKTTTTPKSPAGFNGTEHGTAAYLAGEGVELLKDNGHRWRTGLVSRATLTPLGWRYDVTTNEGARFVVSDWNLRILRHTPAVRQLPLDVVEGRGRELRTASNNGKGGR